MDEKQIRDRAREKMQGYCRVCPQCNGKACAGEVPGMGGLLTGSAFINNIESLAMYHINLRTMHQIDEPDTTLKMFNHTFSSPIFVAPLTGASYNMGGALTEAEFVSCLTEGAKEAGSLAFTGDGAEDEIYTAGLDALRSTGLGIPIIKPRSMDSIKERIGQAEAAGAVAVGIDIDGAGLVTMAMKGHPVGPKTFYQLRELKSFTKLPLILKGIMTVQEAEMAVEMGAEAIVVSNHGGRVLDGTPGVADVLPEIVERVKGEIFVFADGGVRNGIDALKMLALGANAVLVGRPSIWSAFGGGAEGVGQMLEKMTAQLRHGMLMTGCVNLKAIDYHVIY
ncbi:alpha-hydroxy-acid oxidizing protein [Dethiobacter alkaliphilus]|uniref:L-lactate oxidase n=1 Tax=Dethiobacter alkaliphilus AHT 1 TaxID=555088 RepID=C0GFA4_DETAL|nr:alpha-hydroxy-acid oxidizing protein [Dethiobacter alkaliphilus]EEG77864.1 FMN-dependent alpha-hydroxy acid dehydrogenase [Dethiobacter alkaliphilus AHT 1]